MDENQTQFEENLKIYFPHIWALHMLGKSDTHLWELIEVILEMRANDVTGRVSVSYTKGHIDSIRKDIDVLAYKAKRPGY